MKAFIAFLKTIVWKDIFKPRYAIVVDVISMPRADLGSTPGGVKFYSEPVAAVTRLPYHRPLTVPFNRFYDGLSGRGLVLAGSRRVLMSLHGTGSVLKHNMDNAIVFKQHTKDDELIRRIKHGSLLPEEGIRKPA